MSIFRLISGMTTLAIILAACNLPAPAQPELSTGEAALAYTAAAETIMTGQTQTAQVLTPVPPMVTGFPPIPGNTFPAQQENSPTPSPTAISPTATSTPSPSPAPTQTDVPDDPALTLGDPEFEDTFESAANWALYSDDHISFEIDDDRLLMTAFEPEGWDGWVLATPVMEDFYVEMTAEPRQCEGLDRYGLVTRAVNTRKGYVNYLFGVSCDGRYSLRYWDGEEFDTLIDWTESEHLLSGPGETNRLGFYADGEQLALYGNGRLMQEIEDDSSLEGKFGVFVGSAETEDFEVEVEEISAWELD